MCGSSGTKNRSDMYSIAGQNKVNIQQWLEKVLVECLRSLAECGRFVSDLFYTSPAPKGPNPIASMYSSVLY